MAPLRCALLSALTLAADGSLARRLSEPPEACVQACPTVVEFAANMETSGLGHHDDDRSTTTMAEEDHTTLADELAIDFSPTPAPDFVGTEALKAMKAMCQQQDVISCLEENLGACELVPEDFEEVKSHLACTCELCPGIVETQVDIADMLMGALQKELSGGLAGSPQEQDELKGNMCHLASCMQCASEHPAQCSFLETQAGVLDRRLNSIMGQMNMPDDCPQDATCSASSPVSGPEGTQSEPESSSSSKAGEILPRSLIASLLALVVPLLVVAR